MYLYSILFRTLVLSCCFLGTIQGLLIANNDTFTTQNGTPICLNVLQNDNGTNIYVTTSTNTTNSVTFVNYTSFFYQVSGDMLVVDAEHAQLVNFRGGPAYSNLANSAQWQLSTNYSGSAGTGAMVLTPTELDLTNTATHGPALGFKVAFSDSMTYSIFLRGQICAGCSLNTSLHVFTDDGVTGAFSFTTSGSPVTNYSTTYQWLKASGVLNVTAAETAYPPVLKTVYVAMKDSDIVFDKFAMRNSKSNGNNFSVMQQGPAESTIFDCAGGLMYFPKPGFTGVDSFTYQISDGVSFSSAVVTVTVGAVSPSATPTSSPTPSVSPSASTSTSSSPSTTPSISPSRTPTPSISSSPSITPSSSPVVPACPSDQPFRCLNSANSSSCVADSSACVGAVCPDSAPYGCYNGTCGLSPQDCAAPSCSCWNGDCTHDCPPVPSCPDSRPKRCWNGCFTTDVACDATTTCDLSNTCPDGTCKSSGQDCLPYNGCPLTAPIQCSDGSCVENQTQCLCEGGLFRCFGGGCSETCDKPLFLIKPVEVTVSFSVTENSNFAVTGDSQTTIGSLVIPANSVSTSSGNVGTVAILQVTDSEIREDSVIPCSSVLSLQSSSIISPFNTPVTLELAVQIPVDKTIQDLCLAEKTSEGWVCIDTQLQATSDPKIASAKISKTTTVAIVTVPQSQNAQQDNSKQEKKIVKTGIIVGVSISGAIIVGGFVAMMVLYKTRADRRSKMMEQVRNMIHSSSSASTVVDLPA